MEDNERLNDRFHGIGGPWKVSDEHHTCELTRAFLLAAQGIGLPYNPDFNGASQRGVGTWQINARDGRRCSASEAFLRPAMKDRADHAEDRRARPLGHHREGPRRGRALARGQRDARGARHDRGRDGGRGDRHAEDPDALRHRPGGAPAGARRRGGRRPPEVGANLQDHTETPVVALCNGPYGYFGHDRGYRQLRNGLEYIVNRSGPVVSNGVEAGAFLDPFDLDGQAVGAAVLRAEHLSRQGHLGREAGPRHHHQLLRRAPALEGLDPARLGRSGRAAADRPELSRRPRGRAAVDRRRAAGARDHGAGAARRA